MGYIGSRTRFCQSDTSSKTASVTRLIRSADTFRPYTSSRWARMSRVDKPAAYSPMVRRENSPPDCFLILLTAIRPVDPGLAFLDQLRLETAIHCPAVETQFR